MVFDGKHLTPFDEQLLDDLKAAQGAPVTLEGPLDGDPSGPNRRSRRVGGTFRAADRASRAWSSAISSSSCSSLTSSNCTGPPPLPLCSSRSTYPRPLPCVFRKKHTAQASPALIFL